LVADMVYLLADVNAAHTSPLKPQPLGHLDSTTGTTLHDRQALFAPMFPRASAQGRRALA
jgi:hypothetical protein